MLWLIPLLLLLLFLLLRFVRSVGEEVEPYEDGVTFPAEKTGERGDTGDTGETGETEETGDTEEKGKTGKTGKGKGKGKARETKEQDDPLDVPVQEKYKAFLSFYLPFSSNWSEAIQTAYRLEQPAPVSTESPVTPPSLSELNAVIEKHAGKLGKTLPPISEPLPDTLTTVNGAEAILSRIPSSSDSYQNALDWMNEQMLRAQKELGKALTGDLPAMEGFAGEQCADFTRCFQEFIKTQQEERSQRKQRVQASLTTRLDLFQQPRLLQALQTNKQLAQEAKAVQQKAKSGDWIKDVKIPDTGPKMSFEAPEGGDTLGKMCESDPKRCATYEKNHASMFSIKKLMEQISGSLR